MSAAPARAAQACVLLAVGLLLLAAGARPLAAEEGSPPPVRTIRQLAEVVRAQHAAAARRVRDQDALLRAKQAEHAAATRRLADALERNATLLAARRALVAGAGEPARGQAAEQATLVLALRTRTASLAPRELARLRALLAGMPRPPDARAGPGRLAARERELASGLAALGDELRRRDAALTMARQALVQAERARGELLAREAALAHHLAELSRRETLAAAGPALAGSAAARLRPRPAVGPLIRAALSAEEPVRQLTASARAGPPPPAPHRARVALGPARPLGPEAVARPFFPPIAGDRVTPAPSEAKRYRRGLLLASTAPQTVSAPCDGEIVFAEPFKSFGPLLIIDRGDGYHILLSGLSQLGIGRGARVVAGQAVGTIEGDAGRLYLELRRHGSPVDPAVWLALLEDKVRS